MLYGLIVRRPPTSVWCLVAIMVLQSYPGHAACVSKRSCQTDHPVMCYEEALARGWRGELSLYKASTLVWAWKACRMIAAVMCYTNIISCGVVTRHKLGIPQLVPFLILHGGVIDGIRVL